MTTGSRRSLTQQVSIINLDNIIRKVAYTLDDDESTGIRWFSEHHAMSGFGFWDEEDQ